MVALSVCYTVVNHPTRVNKKLLWGTYPVVSCGTQTWRLNIPLLHIYNYIYIHILVGGLEHFLNDFPYIGNVIFSTVFYIFQRGSNHQPVYMYIYIIIYVHGYITFMNYAPLFKWSVLLLHLLWNFVFFWPRPFWKWRVKSIFSPLSDHLGFNVLWVSCHWHTRASHVGYIF